MRTQGFATAGVLVCLLVGVGTADAQPVLARASQLQPPVWVERAGGTRQALRPGAPLYAGDRYFTGKGGRLHIELEDASTVKLGENAEFELPRLEVADDGSDGGLLRGALKVVKGAFRFTTSALGALRKRELDVYVGPTITAGIRGTDIWGKSETEQELLCLLEGRIEVSSPGAPTQVMDQPKTFYVVPRDQPPLPIAPTPEDKLAKWMPQTELKPDEAAQSASGRYRIVIASFGSEGQAQREAAALSEQGYAAEIVPTPIDGTTRYRLLMSGFATQAEAGRFVRDLKKRLNLKNPWVMSPG